MAKHVWKYKIEIELEDDDFDITNEEIDSFHPDKTDMSTKMLMALMRAERGIEDDGYSIVDTEILGPSLRLNDDESKKYDEYIGSMDQKSQEVSDKIDECQEKYDATRILVSMSVDDKEKILSKTPLFPEIGGPFKFYYDGGWGESYTSEEYDVVNWMDALIEANRAMMSSGDTHHVYWERIRDSGNVIGGCRYLILDYRI